ncbi:hypothetical protein CMV_016909 [Castanea mollissima]|uniref:AB hydrolase-1 domain-containing protein n=1 Tax=Castanea mollissima TaxID=60419 RepID=A0A8J4VHP8_9ROSI|nr:hypothetical protein CMV_016909 [Castanea mollissima]
MAWALVSPSLNLSLPHSTMTNFNRTQWFTTKTSIAATTTTKTTRTTSIRANAADQKQPKDKDEDTTSGFSPFAFVTDNPSSREAIQLPESPAEDGNVGEMLYVCVLTLTHHFLQLGFEYMSYPLVSCDFLVFQFNRIEDKGKEYGSYIKSGEFIWFVRETGSAESRRGTIVFLQGAPTQSYSYRVVMSEMSGYGFHCFAPDWIGFGFSDKPQPGYGFDYTEKEFHEEFDKLLDVLGGQISFFPRCSGSFGLTWALKNPSKILKLAILNSLLTVSSPIPGLFQKLRLFICETSKGQSYLVELDEHQATMKHVYHGLWKYSVGFVPFDTMKNQFLATGDAVKIIFSDVDNGYLLTTIAAEGGLPAVDTSRVAPATVAKHCSSSFFDTADRSSSYQSSSIQSTSVLRSIDLIGARTFFILPLFSALVLPMFSILHQIVDIAHRSSSDRSSSVQSTGVLRSIDQIGLQRLHSSFVLLFRSSSLLCFLCSLFFVVPLRLQVPN